MSDEALDDTVRLEKAAAAAKMKLKNYRFIASLWSLATVLMWISVAMGREYMVAGGIAFSGVTVMYWMLARSASIEHANVMKELNERFE